MLRQKKLQKPKLRKPTLSNRKILLGIDEVGRGPWAGPLVIGAVILGNEHSAWEKLTDSKKLTPKRRQELSQSILTNATATGLGWLSSQEIDQFGLGQSLRFAARLAVTNLLREHYPDQFANLANLEELSRGINLPFDEIVIDGTINFLTDTPLEQCVTTLPKADLLVKEVSAASIIAKVARDNYMIKIAEQYPGYGFERHVGYGTAEHRQALHDLGICPEHRRSFRPVQQIMNSATSSRPTTANKSSAATAHGQRAEQLVLTLLQEKGHIIVARNYKTKTYEIDLISHDAQNIYFTEVKYRQTAQHGTPLAQITKQKQQQMHYAAQAFLANHPEFQHLQPLLAVAAVSGKTFQIDDWFTLS